MVTEFVTPSMELMFIALEYLQRERWRGLGWMVTYIHLTEFSWWDGNGVY